MVPEAYRQWFRERRKEDKQSYLELSRDLVNTFNRWRTASVVNEWFFWKVTWFSVYPSVMSWFLSRT